jgi:hypothetical protein
LLHNINRNKSLDYNGNQSEAFTMDMITRIEAMTGDILPSVSEIWAGAISVLGSVDNLFPFQDQCGEAKIPPHHLAQGFPNTDILIYVTIDGP